VTATPAPSPVLRRVPLPKCEPPYDDEVGGPLPSPAASSDLHPVQGTLALSFTLPGGLPAVPEPPAHLRLVRADHDGTPASRTSGEAEPGGAGAGDPANDEQLALAKPGNPAGLPDAKIWTGRLVQAVVEVLGGERPLAQLLRWTTPDVYSSLAARVRATTLRRTPRRPGGRPWAGELPPAPSSDDSAASRALVRSVHVSQPAHGVVEATAVIKRGPRTKAIALRLEGREGRWRCTALEMG
jgi:Family of unknown function (DUF6459)